VGRIVFWGRALRRGLDPLNSAAGWLGLVVLVLGIAAGVAVPLVFHLSHWITAVILMGVLVVIVLEGSYQVWNETEQQRKAAEGRAEAAQGAVPTTIGGAGGPGGGGGGAAATGPRAYAEGGKGGQGYSMLEIIAFSALGSEKPLDYFIRLHGLTPDSPEIRQRFGGGGAGGGGGGGAVTDDPEGASGAPEAPA
jgi:hypothetical protein